MYHKTRIRLLKEDSRYALGDKYVMMDVGHQLHLESVFGFIYRFIFQFFGYYSNNTYIQEEVHKPYITGQTINSDLDNDYL